MNTINKKTQIVILKNAQHFGTSLAKKFKIKPVELAYHKFSSNEVLIHPKTSLAKQKVLVIQSIIDHDALVELLLMLNALKNNKVASIELIMPYCAYARQDKMHEPNQPISFQMIADVITSAAPIKKITVIDIHNVDSLNFFKTNVTNLSSLSNIVDEAINNIKQKKDVVLVSPDFGGLKRINEINNDRYPLAYFRKTRPTHNKVQILQSYGAKVTNKHCIIVDDMIDTGQTIFAVCEILHKLKAKSITVCATHAVLSNNAHITFNSLINKKIISKVYFTNSIDDIYEKNITNNVIYDLSNSFNNK
jgi:ribose-phosphate pyrophosphokinase